MSAADRVPGVSVLPSGRWSVDASRSSVAFALRHMLLSTVSGRFNEFGGVLETGPGSPRASGAIKSASIDTGETVRDEHLRSSQDFFDAERYPEISFSSTRIEERGGRLRIAGELTMRGVTRELALDGRLAEGLRRDPDGVERIQLELRGELSRRDFGLTWNQALDTGGALLGNKVKIELEISAARGEPAEHGSARGG